MYIIGLYGQPTDHFHFKLSGCFLIFFYIFLRVDVLGHLFLVIILVTPGTHPALLIFFFFCSSIFVFYPLFLSLIQDFHPPDS
jgi:hypothetical protein